jgi:hypothetical protein
MGDLTRSTVRPLTTQSGHCLAPPASGPLERGVRRLLWPNMAKPQEETVQATSTKRQGSAC